MRLWLIVKLFAALAVCCLMALTAAIAYHVMVRPLDGIMSQLIPRPASHHDSVSTEELTAIIESQDVPDNDPGKQAYQKAYELLALGNSQEARNKLNLIIQTYPKSSSTHSARTIIGEMNMDELLDSSDHSNKITHTVRPGDSYLAIATKYHTNIDCIIHLNSMLQLKGIQPGDKLLVMPLNFSLVIEPQRSSVAIWNESQLIREYSALSMKGIPAKAQTTSIAHKITELNGRRVLPQSDDYRAARKILQISQPNLQIRAPDSENESITSGILLSPYDMEELALLIRAGSKVEIR